jgi:hypothetical protein
MGMSHDHDEYRRHAKEAQNYADRAISDDDRASWLKVAAGWLGMLPRRAATKQETFDQAVHDQGTGQTDSENSN